MKIPKWLIIVVLLVLCGVLFAAGSNMGGSYIEDTNGDDVFTLQTITDQDIIENKIEGKGIVINSYDDGEESYMANSFSGVYTVFSKECSDENLKITLDYLNVERGNMKMAVVMNEEIVCEFNVNGGAQDFTVHNAQGTVSLVAAGEAAKCSFDYSIEM